MRVLVVEDEVDVARFIRKGLVEQSYAVDVASDGERALYMARLNTYDAAIPRSAHSLSRRSRCVPDAARGRFDDADPVSDRTR